MMPRTRPVLAAALIIGAAGAMLPLPAAHAQAFLVGAVLYSSSSTGVNSGGAYAFSTNSATPHNRLSLTLGASTQQNAISFALANGANNFTFTGVGPVDPGGFAGLEFLFNATGTSSNPAGSTGVPGDLAAVANTNSPGTFFIPLGATSVRSYDNGLNVPYSGATSFNVGGKTISVTALTSDHTPSGSFTLTVANIAGAAGPEPASALLALAGGTALTAAAGMRRRRRDTVRS